MQPLQQIYFPAQEMVSEKFDFYIWPEFHGS